MSQYFSENCSPSAEEKSNIPEEAEVFIFPTSFAQARLWFLNQLAPGNPFYNVSIALRLDGSLNLTALKQTFHEIVRRHETLRTTFVLMEGQPMQAIASTLTIPIPLIDLRHLSATEHETQAREITTAQAQRPFDLTASPLLRVTLLQLDQAEYLLLLNLHHIVADGWSIGVLIRELGAFYTAFVEEKPLLLPKLPIQYADFAQWQREWLVGEVLQTQLTYWQTQLNGISVLNLPTDRLRPPVPTYRGARQSLELPQSLSQALVALSHQEGVTLFMTLLAAFQTLLYRYTQQEDIVIGSPIANRNRSEIEELIGFFVNNLVLRTNLSGNPTFRELLNRVREVTLGAYAHQDLPFEKLVEELHPQRDLSRHPLFQVVFSLQNTPIEALELPGLTLSVFEFDSKTAKLDLEFHLWQDLESLKGQVVYSTDLFDDSTITRMLEHFQTLLENIVANPQQHLANLPILTEAEQHQLLVEFNQNQSQIATTDTHRDMIMNGVHPRTLREAARKASTSALICGSKSKIQQCFHQLFEALSEQTPDAIALSACSANALVFENQHLTYRELNIRANQLAHHLQQLRVAPDTLVGICLERSFEMIIGVLGILKAGGAYLPLDPSYPQERLNFMLKDAKVSILLTHSSLSCLFNRQILPYPYTQQSNKNSGDQQHELTVICIDQDWETITQQSQENPISGVTSNNLAYVIYTSGSTGKPKGVSIEHRGLSNLIQAQIETFNLQSSDGQSLAKEFTHRILQFASLSFDASIFEIVMALATGGTLYLAKKESLLPGQPLIQLLREKAITHITLPPAVLAVLPKVELPALQTIICAGESCPKDIIKRWASGRQFFNAYGATEATVWSTVAQMNATAEKPSIGRPIANTQVYILDQHLQPVPIGIAGELYISGEGLARGYLNRPELTETRFIQETSFLPKTRLYKTGDLARYRSDGYIEFIGRIDNQIKIRGFRIELAEIEIVLRQHQGVQEAVVIAEEIVSGHKRLVAYIVLAENQAATTSELRNFLTEKLPEYMVPRAFVVLSSLPLTPNGKIDIHALPTPYTPNSYSLDKAFVAPRNSTEFTLAKIWAEVLNLESVGIHDNFFDLGGNSLLAVRLVEQIYKQFARELPLSSLFLNSTIETLAKSLSSEKDCLPWSPLVTIQPSGSNPPFFCVHPIFGVVFPYYELAHHLGKNQPFYGLQPLGLDGESSPLTSIEDMATYYIQALRTVQPRGPYFLGGWSFGGLVAFEMAQQLQSTGHEVALLALLDTVAPVSANKPSVGKSLKFLFTTVARYIWSFFLDYFYLMTASNKNQVNSLTFHFPIFHKFIRRIETNLFSHFIPQESKSRILRELTIRPMLRVFHANSQATLKYVPKMYPQQITLFKTTVQSSIADQDPTMGWGDLTLRGVEIYNIPGNHLTMLRNPHIQILGKQLKTCIEKSKTL